jgi:hypothetical protein
VSTVEITRFWNEVRQQFPHLSIKPPPAWAFGANAQQADELLQLVLEGRKTATASTFWDYETNNESLPTSGELHIILDGSRQPQAVIEITAVNIVPFIEVTAQHAYAEGEGDRSLDFWRKAHQEFWNTYAENPRGFDPAMPVVCESFLLIYPRLLPLG